MRLQDKVVIITGAGGGMGRTAALMFAATGRPGGRRRVRRGGRRRDRPARSRRPAAGRRSSRSTCRTRPRPGRWSTTPSRPTAGVDVLYNNAGIMPEADHSVIDTDVDAWDQVMAVNVRGVFLGCKFAIPQMVEQGGGLDHQHRELRRAARLLGPAGRLHRLEGRAALADPEPRRPVRAERRPDERDLPRPGRDAAAHGLAGQGRGGEADPARPQPDRPVRQARGDRQHGALSRVGRVALDERRPARGRRRHHASTTSEERVDGRPRPIAVGVDVGGQRDQGRPPSTSTTRPLAGSGSASRRPSRRRPDAVVRRRSATGRGARPARGSAARRSPDARSASACRRS